MCVIKLSITFWYIHKLAGMVLIQDMVQHGQT